LRYGATPSPAADWDQREQRWIREMGSSEGGVVGGMRFGRSGGLIFGHCLIGCGHILTDSLHQCPGSHAGCQLSGMVQTCGWSPWSPCRGTFSASHHPRRSTLLEPQWLLLATSPSSL
uniref:Uncharacterized protein n=1 Tax=Echeneis naucrates TaxID=173247 RepID=A0A665V112_ECHNA